MPLAALKNPEIVAWACFVLGIAVMVVGVVDGLRNAPKKAAKDKELVKEASEQAEQLKAQQDQVRDLSAKGEATAADEKAAEASSKAESSVLASVGTIVASLPEYQRFPGMLVLLGVVLMGVATIQFGGTSIF
jgi:Flp pilus assembly protein TadB